MQYQFSCAPKLARKYEIEHCSRSSKTINWSAESFQINTSPRWFDTWARDMFMGYWSVAIVFWQLSIDHIVNVLYKRCGLAKTRLRHPSLPFDSLPYPTHTIRRRVRTYARSVTWQPNEKRFTIFHEYGALSHARFARAEAPLIRPNLSEGKDIDAKLLLKSIADPPGWVHLTLLEELLDSFMDPSDKKTFSFSFCCWRHRWSNGWRWLVHRLDWCCRWSS